MSEYHYSRDDSQEQQDYIRELQEQSEYASGQRQEYEDTYNETGEYPVVQDDIGKDTDAKTDQYESMPEDCDAVARMHEGTDDPATDDYLTDVEQMKDILGDFTKENWEGMSLDEKCEALTDFQRFQAEFLGVDPAPEVEFYSAPGTGEYGAYSEQEGKIFINIDNIDDPGEAVDTIAHESRHAYQHMRAMNPQNERDMAFAENLNDYISPDDDFDGYQNQLVEKDAEMYGSAFKGYISMIEG